ncbi:MAG: adenosine deaminase [Thermoanaerobaculia bacterium]|nr:adenosine deaminase [Thermoanaerobaculia bacterium]
MTAAAAAEPGVREFLAAMPKAELHLHFEGAILPATLLTLARRRRVTLPADDEEGLARWFRFDDFEHFVEIYVTISSCLRDPEDFQLALRQIAAEQERQNVLVSELHFTISTHAFRGVNADEVADALGETIGEERRRRGIVLGLIPDIVRNMPRERADQTLEWALAHRGRGVVALGLAGIESWPLAPFEEHFQVAEREGLHRVVHAGEQEGAESVRAALTRCGAERIAHGIGAIEEPALVEELAAAGVPLDVCPSSNVRLGMVPSLEEHPLGRLEEAGVTLTLGTDDPPLFETSLNREYQQVHRAFGLGPERLAGIALDGVRHAFLPAEERSALETRFRAACHELGERHLGRPVEPAVAG